jgi:hypothetical protein
MAAEKKKKKARPLDPPAPKPSEQVPAGDDSDINEGRDLDLTKDGDRGIASPDPGDERGQPR